MTLESSAAQLEAFAALSVAAQALEEAGITYFLSNGTLLGCIREGTFVPHDSDIDIGVLSTDGLLEKFIARGFELRREWGSAGKPAHEYTFIAPGFLNIKLDVFCYTLESDHSWMGLWTEKCPCKACANLPPYKKMIFPKFEGVVQKDFYGMRFPVPSNYEKFLTAQYGDWWIVDKDYHWFNSPKNLQ